jgi:hypothetical protein
MPHTSKKKEPKPNSQPTSLKGWEQIAAFLGQPGNVTQRWAKEGMPVRRQGRYVTASRDELRQWLGREAGTLESVHIAQTSDRDLIADLRRSVTEMRVGRKRRT